MVSVVGLELVVEVVAFRSRNEVQPVEGSVTDHSRGIVESGDESHRLEQVEPLAVAGRLVVADDGEEGDVGVRKRSEHVDGAEQVGEARLPVVEQVAGVDDRVHLVRDGVVGDAPEGVEEVLPSLRQVVLPVAEVGVARVYHPCHGFEFWLPRYRGVATAAKVKRSSPRRVTYVPATRPGNMDLALDAVAAHTPVTAMTEEREAAVVVPIVERDGREYLLFIKKADHLGSHAGQMSFPGGGREPSDEDLYATALREAREEVDMHTDAVAYVGQLDDIATVSGYAVRPFVVRAPDQTWVPDDREVAEVVPLPIDELVDLDNYESEERDHPQRGNVRLHFFRVDGYTVWGATGWMLVQFLELSTEWRQPTEPDRVVDPDAEFPV